MGRWREDDLPTWNPHEYLKFSDHRLRPALDLMGQIPLDSPQTIYDLGCGPGNITNLLVKRWPGAAVTGVDSSADMLVRASQEAPEVSLIQADIAQWSPPAPVDLLFSNATMHWLHDHGKLFPRLAARLVPGGVLAVQMPCNRDAPCNLLIEAVASDGPWRERLSQVRSVFQSVEFAQTYYRILAPVARFVDIWETEYLHILKGDNPVLEWNKGAALRPYLDVLGEVDRDAFLDTYAARILAAYPKQPDGRTLLPYRRIFLIAQV
jgi:trans-aconitate 2-methyltransferase